jgi:hypothetical protein
LNLAKYRVGQFDIVVNTGGTLSSGVITGGTNALWYFKDGTANANLRRKIDSVGLSNAIKDSLINYVAKQTQNPTAIINPSISYERQPSGTFVLQFDWNVGRQAATSTQRATDSILTVSVDGTNRIFTQPAVGASYNGSTNLTLTYNTNKTVNLLVTTKDFKTATDAATVTVYDKRYIGWATTTTPSDAEIRAAINQDNNGGTVAYSATLAQLGSARYLFYANTVTCTSVTVNGFPSTSAFTLNASRTFTNAGGGVTTYYVTTSNNAIGATSTTALIVN